MHSRSYDRASARRAASFGEGFGFAYGKIVAWLFALVALAEVL